MAKSAESAKATKGARNQSEGAETHGEGFRVTPLEREAPGRAMKHVMLGTILFAAATVFYVYQARITARVHNAVVDAAPLIKKGDLGALNQVSEAMDEALELRSRHKGALLTKTVGKSLEWLVHGMDEESTVRELVERASAARVEHADFTAVKTLIATYDGNLEQAQTELDQAQELQQSSPLLYWATGLAKTAQGDITSALSALESAARTGSSYPYIGTTYGDLLYASGSVLEAYSYWNLAEKSNANFMPANARALSRLIERGEPYNRVAKAQKDLEKLGDLGLSPMDIQSRKLSGLHLALFSGDAERTQEALASLLTTVTTSISSKVIPLHLAFQARAQEALGQVDQSLISWASATETLPAYGWLKSYANVLNAQERSEETLAMLDNPKLEEAGIAPELIDYLKGQAWLAAKNYPEARQAFEKLVDAEGYKSKGYFGLGQVSVGEGEFSTAIDTHFKEALALRVNFPELHDIAGDLAISMRKIESADYEYQVAEQQWLAQGLDGFKLKSFYEKVVGKLRSSGYQTKAWDERLDRLEESRAKDAPLEVANP